MKKVLVILQNAWSPAYAGTIWPRPSWLKALHRSRSGIRLKYMADAAGPDFEFDYDNTTPSVTPKPNGVEPIDFVHVQGVLARFAGTDPGSTLVLCGYQASQILTRFIVPRPTLVIPHPAYRVVTNDLLIQAGRLIREGFEGTVQLRQGRGRVEQTSCKSSPQRA